MPLIVLVHDRTAPRVIPVRLMRSIATGVELRTFGTPIEALDWLATHDADLIVTDHSLPALDAAAFIRRLRALAGRLEVPVMVITPLGSRPNQQMALKAGASDFVRSPVDHAEFVSRSRILLRLHAQQRVIRARAIGLEAALADSKLSHEKLVRDSAEALAQVIDTVPAFVSAADVEGRIVFANAMHGIGIDHPMFATPPVAQRDPAPAFDDDYQARSRALDALVFLSGRPLPAFEQEVAGRNGERRVLLTTKSPLRDSSGAIGSVLTTSLDITVRKELERHLQHVASHDGLTDLPNRGLLQARLASLLDRAGRGNRGAALFVLDLDRFKAVNDRLGHLAGDDLLRAAASRLHECVGPGDMVARIGGDEFAVLQGAINRMEEAAALAQRILDALARPVMVAGQEVAITASVGVSLSSLEITDPRTGAKDMMRHADLAMYQSKQEGGNRMRFFVPDMDRRLEHALQIQDELKRALCGDELILHYQPQMNLRTSRVRGVEALLRWNHPIRGLIGPGEFLPVAEESGMMAEIDEWVLRRACAEAASWGRSGFDDVRVGVNISPLRISAERTRDVIAASLGESGLDPSLLEIELTERDLVSDLHSTARALAELRGLGVHVAIDDFGIGYSFLGHVKALPADRIKIDQSFIRGLLTDEGDATIVKAVVAMAHGLRLGVVAEGVETVEQLTQLALEGCDDIQGFYFSRPLPLPELMARLRDNQATLS